METNNYVFPRKSMILGQSMILDRMQRLLEACAGEIQDENFSKGLESYDEAHFGARFDIPVGCHILAEPIAESVCLRFRIWFKPASGGSSQCIETHTYKSAISEGKRLKAAGCDVEDDVIGVVWDNATGSFAECAVIVGR